MYAALSVPGLTALLFVSVHLSRTAASGLVWSGLSVCLCVSV